MKDNVTGFNRYYYTTDMSSFRQKCLTNYASIIRHEKQSASRNN